MKTILRCLVIGFTFALYSCLPSQTPAPVAATRTIAPAPAQTPTPPAAPATEAPLLPTFTSIPATLAPTTTFTPEPTPTLLPAITVAPFTQGSILFLWNEEPPPPPEESPGHLELGPTVNLYLAEPGAAPEEWQITPLLENLRAYPPLYLSPDETKAALRILEDSERYVNGIYRIHVYSFTDGSFERIENAINLDTLSWLADNQTLVFPQEKEIFISSLDGSPPQPITNNTDPSEDWFEGRIGQLAGSPDGRFQALNVYPDRLAIYDMESGETFPIATGLGRDHLTLKWSPDSQWLAFTRNYGLSLFVVNTHDHIVSELAVEETSIYYPSWSPDGHWLAFTQSSRLHLWDSETEITTELTSAHYIGVPAWSPDGTSMAAGFVEEDRHGILVLDPASTDRQELILGMIPGVLFWSPDGQWLLFHAGQNDQTGLYIVNRNSGTPYLVVDTTGKQNALEYFSWLSR